MKPRRYDGVFYCHLAMRNVIKGNLPPNIFKKTVIILKILFFYEKVWVNFTCKSMPRHPLRIIDYRSKSLPVGLLSYFINFIDCISEVSVFQWFINEYGHT
jgi:hypothetical protein